MKETVKILKVSKEGNEWYFGGYGYEGDISYEHSPLRAYVFNTEKALDDAIEYVENAGFEYVVMYLEYDVYEA